MNGGDPAPARVDAELPALPGDVALDAVALGELGLLDQVAGRQEEIGLAVDKCQQACPLTVTLQQLQGGEDLQQMLSRLMGRMIVVVGNEMILITPAYALLGGRGQGQVAAAYLSLRIPRQRD